MNTKPFLIASFFIAGIFIANTGYSQVYVSARVGFGIPAPRVYCTPPPAPVVYEEPCPAPAPYYGGYAPGPVVVVDRGYGYRHDRYGYDRYHQRPYREYARGYDRRAYDRRYEHRRNW